MHGNGMRRRDGVPRICMSGLPADVAISHQQRRKPVNHYQMFSLKALASLTLG